MSNVVYDKTFGGCFMKLNRHRPDFALLLTVILLVLTGLVIIYSASTILAFKRTESTDFYFMRQLTWVVVGFFVMLFTMNIRFTVWKRLSKLALLGSYIMMLLVLIPGIGVEVGGARRWLDVGITTFQPSDLAMIGIIIYLSYLLAKKQDRIHEAKASYWPSMILMAIGFILIMLEPDMDTAVTFVMCPFAIMFAAGVPFKYIRNTVFAGIALLIPLALYSYRGDRVVSYFDPWADKTGDGYQVIHSLYAIATGGWTGRGMGHSIEKFSYLPEPHTDFIFAVLSEEWGFIGALFLIVLYGVLIWRGIHIATHSQDRFAGLVAIGITTMIALPTFFNIGSVTNLLPVIGVPLPFVSYGGTSLLVKLFAMGILLNISRYTVEQPINEKTREKTYPRQQGTGNSRFNA